MANDVGTKNDHYHHALTGECIVVLSTLIISLYNAAELLLLIFITFKRWGGLYFWSLLVASLGVLVYSIGYMCNYFELSQSYTGLAINNIGWCMMISGQSFVLYSRLHLVLNDRRILRAVLIMIIVDGIVFTIPTTIMNFASNYDNHPLAAAEGYKVYEKVQMTGFCIQEFIISGLYLWKTTELLKVISREDARRTMWQLFSINVIIVIMDLALLGVEYRNERIYEQAFKGVVYSVKVKLEYAILGKLVQLVKGHDSSHFDVVGAEHDGGIADVVDNSKSTENIRGMSIFARKRSHATGKSVSASHIEKAEVHEKSQLPSSDNTSDTRVGHHAHHDSTSTASMDPERDGDLYASALRQISKG